MDRQDIELKVAWHESGRYTLMEKSGSSTTDIVEENLSGNSDPATFYRAVALHIAKRVEEGWKVTYKDTSLDKSIKFPGS